MSLLVAIAGLLGFVRAGKTEPAPPVARVEPRMSISHEALTRIGRLGDQPTKLRLYTTTPISEENRRLVFKPAEPPPGVVPKGTKPMAMDDWGGFAGASAWNLAGEFSENLHWLGFQYLAELSQRPEYRRISETIAREMTRRWLHIKAKGDDDQSEKIKVLDEWFTKHKIRAKFRRCCELDGYFGRGHMYIDTGHTDDAEVLKAPLILDRRTLKKGLVRQIKVVEPSWTYPGAYDASNPLSPDFYVPKTWYVMSKEVHATRLLTFVAREMPDLLKPAYSFGGLSLSQMAKPYVDNWLRTRQSVSDLVHSFSVMVLLTDMSAALNKGAGQEEQMRAMLFNYFRDNNGLFMVDKTKEDFKNVSASLGTIDKLQAQSQEQMASVTGEPLVVLTGISPSGLNATTEGELQVWAQFVRAAQEHLFDDHVTTILKVAQLDAFGEIDPSIGHEWEPLEELSEKDIQDARKAEADTDAVYVGLGAVGADEIREKLAADPDSPYSGIDLSGPPPTPPEEEEDPLGGGGDDGPDEDGDGGGGSPAGGGSPDGTSVAEHRASQGAAKPPAAQALANMANKAVKGADQALDDGGSFVESDHPRDHGKFVAHAGMAQSLGVANPAPTNFGHGGAHGGGIVVGSNREDHAAAHSRMTKAGFKRSSSKSKTDSVKLGRSTAHVSSKVQNSIYEHPEGHTAEVKTSTPKYGDKVSRSSYTVHMKEGSIAADQALDDGGSFVEGDHPRGEGGEFSKAQGEALSRYTKASHVNTVLRHGLEGALAQNKEVFSDEHGQNLTSTGRRYEKAIKQSGEDIPHLDAVFNSQKTSEPLTLKRAVHKNDPIGSPDLKPGDVVTTPIHMSSTQNEKLANRFMRPGSRMVTINAPSGSKVFDVGRYANKADKGADERIIPSGSKFEVVSNGPGGPVLKIIADTGQAHDADSAPVKRYNFDGLQIGIETPKGEVREGRSGQWACEMPADYGYIMRTTGHDGDRVDVFVGPLNPTQCAVFVIEQHRLTGAFDEHKVMLGFEAVQEAVACYDRAFGDGSGPDRRQGILEMPFGELKSWLKEEKTDRRVSKAEADYTPDGGEDLCSGCRHFTTPDDCSKVVGQVMSSGWCKFHEEVT